MILNFHNYTAYAAKVGTMQGVRAFVSTRLDPPRGSNARELPKLGRSMALNPQDSASLRKAHLLVLHTFHNLFPTL